MQARALSHTNKIFRNICIHTHVLDGYSLYIQLVEKDQFMVGACLMGGDMKLAKNKESRWGVADKLAAKRPGAAW